MPIVDYGASVEVVISTSPRSKVDSGFSYILNRRTTNACVRESGAVRYSVLTLYSGASVSKLKPTRDIQPVTEFRANAAQFIEQVRDTGEPMILTQHGRSAAVLLDVVSYESLMDEIVLLRDVRQAEDQVAAGKGVSHASVAKKLRARLRR